MYAFDNRHYRKQNLHLTLLWGHLFFLDYNRTTKTQIPEPENIASIFQD